MDLTLHISGETEQALRQQAMASGKLPEVVALEVLESTLASADDSAAMLPRKQWKAEFEALLASMPDGNVDADLSRASVYEGRGE
jgi:hypothetical protein